MDDITIIFLTVNKVPLDWASYHKKVLLEAIGNTPLIAVSRVYLNWPEIDNGPSNSPGNVYRMNLIQEESISPVNVYRQLLKACKFASTPYVAVAEDDVLYSKEHFSFYRPPMNTFAYDRSSWALFTWGTPTYSLRGRVSNSMMIAPRELAIEALEERFAKWPDDTSDGRVGELGRDRVERRLRVSRRNMVEVWCEIPCILFHHAYEMDDIAVRKRKKMGAIRAFDIPFWGKAKDLVGNFK